MVSNVNNKSIFDFDERLKFIGIDFNSKEKYIFQIAKKVKVASRNIDFNGIYDLHDVIRSKYFACCSLQKQMFLEFLKSKGV